MKHLLILLSILLSSFLVSCEKKIGQGTITSPDGDKYVGEWKDNNFWNGGMYNKKGKRIVKYVNGKRIKP